MYNKKPLCRATGHGFRATAVPGCNVEAFSVHVEGGDAIAAMLARLDRLGKKDFKTLARKSAREAATPILDAARAAAPVRTGRLKRAIRKSVWKHPAAGEVGIKISIARGKSRDDPRGAYYGAMIETGYLAGGRYVPGRYMLTNAHAMHGAAAAAKMAADLARAADAAIKG
jgi:hypothetical protein